MLGQPLPAEARRGKHSGRGENLSRSRDWYSNREKQDSGCRSCSSSSSSSTNRNNRGLKTTKATTATTKTTTTAAITITMTAAATTTTIIVTTSSVEGTEDGWCCFGQAYHKSVAVRRFERVQRSGRSGRLHLRGEARMARHQKQNVWQMSRGFISPMRAAISKAPYDTYIDANDVNQDP